MISIMICKRSTWKHLIEALFLLMLVSGLVFFCFACSPCEHSDAEWVIDEEATLDSEGSRHLECPSCGQTISTESIPMLELTEAEIKKKLSHSLVKVLTYDYDGKTELAQGSGFFINRTGTFITNAHVVENCYYIKIKSYLGTTYDVDCMYAYNYDSSDYAICKAKNCYSSSAVEFDDSVVMDETVYAFGFPKGALTMRTSSGTIIATDNIDGKKHYYANTAKIDHGSSGGALVNSKGRVIGITTGELEGGDYCAIRYEDIKQAVNKTYYTSKDPAEFFHKKTEVQFLYDDIGNYFDVNVVATPSYNKSSVRYDVTVKLKDLYKHKKISIKGSSLSFSVYLTTNYYYVKQSQYGGSPYYGEYPDFKSSRFTFTNNNLYSTDSNIINSYMTHSEDCYKTTYEVSFSVGAGSIVIYD